MKACPLTYDRVYAQTTSRLFAFASRGQPYFFLLLLTSRSLYVAFRPYISPSRIDRQPEPLLPGSKGLSDGGEYEVADAD